VLALFPLTNEQSNGVCARHFSIGRFLTYTWHKEYTSRGSDLPPQMCNPTASHLRWVYNPFSAPLYAFSISVFQRVRPLQIYICGGLEHSKLCTNRACN
jgi:hypothetical protein